MKLSLFLILFFFQSAFAKEEKGSVRPLADPCWGKCLKFKMSAKPCACGGKVGFKATFFEPLFFIDVTDKPYHFVSLGGIDLLKEREDPFYKGVKKKGSVHVKNPGNQSGFSQVHFYIFPMSCLMTSLLNMELPRRKTEILIPYLSELDLSWNQSKWSLLIDPESFLFANPLMQMACLGDCGLASMGKALKPDPLFWCAGCSGSLYPLSGHVEHYRHSTQASWLLAQRVLAKLHKIGLLAAYSDEDPCKGLEYQPIMRKRNYRLQMVYPENKKNCDLPGATTLSLAFRKKVDPKRKRDFSYIVWRRRVSCLGLSTFL